MTDICRKQVEILAPAGSLDILKKAFAAGADAVYAGGSSFGARAFAHNFTEEEMLEGIDFAHLHGKKLYMTVNTLIKEREFEQLYHYLLPYYREGLDAVIVQDLGAVDFIMNQFPDLPVHASTQMTVTNLISASFLEKQGVVRVVPARELSLQEIRSISENTSLEIECFVHGALCYCYSGQCLMSSLIGGRSGNRGQCAQPCRLPWRVGRNTESRDLLSMKDLCTIDLIPELVEAGITSFKIEGRMKQSEYVETVTSLYRKYTDFYMNLREKNSRNYHVSKDDRTLLFDAYRRRGYTDGYYKRHNGRQMISLSRPALEKERKEKPSLSAADSPPKEKIRGILNLSAGKSAKLVLKAFSKNGNICVTTEGDIVQHAKSQPVSPERLLKQLRKTGDSEFVFEDIQIRSDDAVFLPIQAVNALRRQALSDLKKEVLRNFERNTPDRLEAVPFREKISTEEAGEPPVFVSVHSVEQLEAVLKYPFIKRIYYRDTMILEKGWERAAEHALHMGKKLYFMMASIFRNEAEKFYEENLTYLMKVSDGAMVRNPESFFLLKKQGFSKPVDTGSSVYHWNRRAESFWNRLGRSYWEAPLELNKRELLDLDSSQMILPVYGYLPVMTSAGCIQKNLDACTGKPGWRSLYDRYGKRFMVQNECAYCYNTIYNTTPLVLTDLLKEIRLLSPAALFCHFTWEDAETTASILSWTEQILAGENYLPPQYEFTRGHFNRGVK